MAILALESKVQSTPRKNSDDFSLNSKNVCLETSIEMPQKHAGITGT
jgi:hypothetical protein